MHQSAQHLPTKVFLLAKFPSLMYNTDKSQSEFMGSNLGEVYYVHYAVHAHNARRSDA